ncbi:MAG: hypothetical protein KDD25_10510, partial [Bdellovibrionales bacterium]|nr:hypothetical protein [Bdellovibrionales bacterium]
PMSEEDFGECYFTVKERLNPQRPSHFEMLTIMAAYYFFEMEKVDYAVFEVGMGGTWDATNAIPHGVSVIAKLGFDHQHLLGNTIEEIASNKFGIIGDEGLVFSLPVSSDLNDLKSNKIKSTNCVWMEAPHFEWEVQKGLPPDYTAQTKWGELKTSMLGERALENLNLALLTFEGMGFKPEKRINALSQFEWTGRMSQLQSDEFQTPVYLSGDHNGQGIQSLISLLKNFEYENLYFVAGVGKKKDLDEVLGPLFRFVDPKNIILTTASFMGRTKEELSPYVEKAATYVEKPIEALRASTERSSVEDLIVVTGSLYLVGDVLTQIQSGSV